MIETRAIARRAAPTTGWPIGRRLTANAEDVPGVGQCPVGAAPERLDSDFARAGAHFSGQPACRAPFGIGARAAPLEPSQLCGGSTGRIGPDDHRIDPVETRVSHFSSD